MELIDRYLQAVRLASARRSRTSLPSCAATSIADRGARGGIRPASPIPRSRSCSGAAAGNRRGRYLPRSP
jgi:hypothetical protein